MVNGRLLGGAVALPLLIGLAYATTASATPAAGYPDTGSYRPVSSVYIYQVTNETGVWFTTPLGVRCAIEDDGSFGCSGELPGTPPGIDEVAWFVGDPFPRLYDAPAQRFSSPDRQAIVNESTYLTYRGTRCAVTPASGVYCIHGQDPNSQIMVTSGAILRGAQGLPAT